MEENSNKIILDLCGGTGAWSKPYREAGFTVHNITLPAYDVQDVIFQADKIHCINRLKNAPLILNTEAIYGILAAPPCTMFSLARRTAKAPPDFTGAMRIVSACLNIIWQCRIRGTLKFWAIENPRGLLRQFLGKPPFSFEQWEFGGKISKHTDLWGYFNTPTKTTRVRPQVDLDKEWQKPEAPEWCKDIKPNRTEIRAITPTGFANAFYKANR